MNNSSSHIKNAFLLKNQNLINTAVEMLLSLIFACAIAFSLTRSFDATSSVIIGILVMLAVYAFLNIMFINKVSRIISSAVLVVLAAAAALFILLNLEAVSEFIDKFYTWFYEYSVGYDTSKNIYSSVLIAAVYVLSAIASYILTYKKFNFPLTALCGAMVFVIQWITGYFVSYACFYIFIALLFIFYFKDTYKSKITARDRAELREQRRIEKLENPPEKKTPPRFISAVLRVTKHFLGILGEKIKQFITVVVLNKEYQKDDGSNSLPERRRSMIYMSGDSRRVRKHNARVDKRLAREALRLQHKQDEEKQRNVKKLQCNLDFAPLWAFLACMLPIALVLTLVAARIPYSDQPMKMPWLDRKLRETFEYIDYLSRRYTEYDYFSVANTGFGESGWLGGNVNLDKTPVMTVRTSTPGQYLRGSVKDYYTGNEWLSSSGFTELTPVGSSLATTVQYDSEYSLDDYAMLNWGIDALGGGKPVFLKSFRRADGSVNFIRLTTKTLFTPLNAIKLNLPAFYTVYSGILTDDHRVFTTRVSNTDDFDYSYTAYNLSVLDSDMESILNRAGTGLFDWLDTHPEFTAYAEFTYTDGEEGEYSADGDSEEAPESLNAGRQRITFLRLLDEDGSEIPYTYRSGTLTFYSGPLVIVMNALDIAISSINDRVAYTYYSQINKVSETEGTKQDMITDNGDGTFLLKLTGSTADHCGDTEALKAYDTYVRSKYLQLPDTLPERVRELAAEVTADCETDYEKIRAVETYLAENYTYTLRPGIAPKEYDFVDYFLFEKPYGYCTYYASALAVMLRSIDIPTRYTEGFVMPGSTTNISTYTITNEYAHAWTEVYLEGMGWYTFESTPKYNISLYDRIIPKLAADSPDISTVPGSSDMYLPHSDSYVDDGFVPEEVAEKISLFGKFLNIFSAVITSIFGIIGLFVLVNFIRIKLFLRGVNKLDINSAIGRLYDYFLKLYGTMGELRMPHETPLEFCDRMYSGSKTLVLKQSGKSSFYTATDCFMRAVYGGKPMTEKDKADMLNYYERTLDRTRYTIGSLKYFWLRYITGQI